MKGSELQKAAEKAGFEPSFVALAPFPQVVDLMAGNPTWTSQLGGAFAVDKEAVFDSIQRLRAKSQAVGNLKSTPQQTVETQTTQGGQQVIVIEPANPQVVYVPQYNPQVVYTQPATTTVVVEEDDDDDEAARGRHRLHRRHRHRRGHGQQLLLRALRLTGGGAYMYNDAWDDYYDNREDAREDYYDNREDAREDYADHREDMTENRGERAEDARENRGDRAENTQEQRRARTRRSSARTGRSSAPSGPRPRSSRRPRDPARASGRRPQSAGLHAERQRGRTRSAERSGTRSDAFSGYSSGSSTRSASDAASRSRSSGGRSGGRSRRPMSATGSRRLAVHAGRGPRSRPAGVQDAGGRRARSRETVRGGDLKQLVALFGPEGQALVDTSDPATGRRNREVFVAAAVEGWRLTDIAAGRKELVLGNEAWPFPVPLVKGPAGWSFDAAAGKEEVLTRRIGRNELAVLRVLDRTSPPSVPTPPRATTASPPAATRAVSPARPASTTGSTGRRGAASRAARSASSSPRLREEGHRAAGRRAVAVPRVLLPHPRGPGRLGAGRREGVRRGRRDDGRLRARRVAGALRRVGDHDLRRRPRRRRAREGPRRGDRRRRREDHALRPRPDLARGRRLLDRRRGSFRADSFRPGLPGRDTLRRAHAQIWSDDHEWNRRRFFRTLGAGAAGVTLPRESGGRGAHGHDAAKDDGPALQVGENIAVADTKHGRVRGYVLRGIHYFLGIPYGADTVGRQPVHAPAEAQGLDDVRPGPVVGQQRAPEHGQPLRQHLRRRSATTGTTTTSAKTASG